MGRAYVVRGELDAAIECYRKAAEIKPTSYLPWYNMACAYALKGEVEKGLESLHKAVTLNPACQQQAREDPELNGLRNHPQFERLINPRPA